MMCSAGSAELCLVRLAVWCRGGSLCRAQLIQIIDCLDKIDREKDEKNEKRSENPLCQLGASPRTFKNQTFIGCGAPCFFVPNLGNHMKPLCPPFKKRSTYKTRIAVQPCIVSHCQGDILEPRRSNGHQSFFLTNICLGQEDVGLLHSPDVLRAFYL